MSTPKAGTTGELGFDSFYEETSRRVLAQIYASCGDLGEAQDCLQEAYMRAWQRWSKLASYDNPEVWVRTVALRLATSRWRKAQSAMKAWGRRGPERHLGGPDADGVALVAGLRSLPWPQRQALVLYHIGGLPVAEIAQVTGVPEGTVKARLARGRGALSTLLSEES